MFIYAITNDVNDKAYIGLHFGPDLRTRWCTHRSFAKSGSGSLISKAMRKHGIEKFHMTSVWSGHIRNDQLKELERYFIRSFRTKTPNGYNLTDGGDGTPGYRHSEEERRRRTGRAGYRHSEETKEKIRLSNLGKKKGRKHTAETRAKMSASHKALRAKKSSEVNDQPRRDEAQDV